MSLDDIDLVDVCVPNHMHHDCVIAAAEAGKKGDKEDGPPPKPKEELTPLDLLNQDLEKAVTEERYEDAARLRDEIRRLKNTHTDN